MLAEDQAIGVDGTEYTIAVGGAQAVPEGAPRTLCKAARFALQANYPQVAGVTDRFGPARWSVTLPTPAGLEDGGVCDDEEFFLFGEDGVRCEITFNVQPQNDGSVRVTSTTQVIVDGVDGNSLDFSILFHNDTVVLATCCPAPDEQEGEDPVAGGTRVTLVDASGHPGFHRQEDTLVPNFDLVTAGVSAGVKPGERILDPCAIAGTGSWACGPLPAGSSSDGCSATVRSASRPPERPARPHTSTRRAACPTTSSESSCSSAATAATTRPGVVTSSRRSTSGSIPDAVMQIGAGLRSAGPNSLA